MRFAAAILGMLALTTEGYILRSRGGSYRYSSGNINAEDKAYAIARLSMLRSSDRTSAIYKTKGGRTDVYCEQVAPADGDTSTPPECQIVVKRLPDEYNDLKVSLIRGVLD